MISYSQLFVRFDTGAQVRLDRVPRTKVVGGGEEITLTLGSYSQLFLVRSG